MGRYSGEMLLNVQSRTAVLLCAGLLSLLSSVSVNALSVNSTLESVLSVVKGNETNDSAVKPEQSRADDKTFPANANAPRQVVNEDIAPAAELAFAVDRVAPVTLEPMAHLSAIDAPIVTVRTQSPVKPVDMTARAHAGDSFAMLQVSRDGWRLAGVAWYWWAALLGAGYYSVRRAKAIQ